MIVLDTDHLSELRNPHNQRYALLTRRLQESSEDTAATTIVSIEEQMRGWLAIIHRIQDVHKQIPKYRDLTDLLHFASYWRILPFDSVAADLFLELRQQRVRIGSMDLKIAAITIAEGALLLSRNLRD